MTVSLAEVALAAHARQAPLPAESAGYLVLAVADQVALAARAVRKEAIELNEDGSVRLAAGEPATESQAEQQLRSLLAELLHSASSLTPALVRVSSRPPLADLKALVSELEAALIPVNRAAARRALARLSRETARAREQGRLTGVPEPPPPPAHHEPEGIAIEVDVEVEPTPEPLAETRPEPLARRASLPPPLPASTPSDLPGPTPRLGTLVAPSVRVEPQDPGDVTDPMPSVEEASPAAPELEALPEPAVVLKSIVQTLPLPLPEPEIQASPEPEPEPDPVPRIPRPREPKRSELGSLLRAFASEAGPSEPELRRELKRIAGVELTPSPAVTSDR